MYKRQAQLDLTQAALVNESETKEQPTLWSDSGKGTIQANESQPLYIWTEYASGKAHIYLDQDNLGVEAQVDGASYETLAQALEAAGLSEGDKAVTLLKNVSVGSGEQAESRSSGAALTLPAGVTLNGQGHTVTYTGESEIDSLLAVDGADSAIRNTCFAGGGCQPGDESVVYQPGNVGADRDLGQHRGHGGDSGAGPGLHRRL